MSSTAAGTQEDAQSSSPVAIVTLEVVSPPSTFRFPKRTITLGSHKTVMPLGRSSKVAAKGFTPEQGNGWFDSPVMSRNHAILSVDMARERVSLTDTGSTHGTHVDHEKLDPNVPKCLSNNDKIRFGVQISRSTEIFPPCYVVARIQWSVPRPEPEPAKSLPGKYSLPDESDNDNSSDSSDSDPQEERPRAQSALPNINLVPPMPMQADDLPEPKSDIRGPSHITSIDLTEDAEAGSEDHPAKTINIAGGNSPVEPGSPHGISCPSTPRSSEPSANPPAVVDLTSPRRAPTINLNESPDVLELSAPKPASLDGGQCSPVDNLNRTHFLDSTDGVGNGWGLADYSNENGGADPSEDDDREVVSEMNDEDAEMFSGDQEDDDDDDDDEIHDDDERDLNMPPGQHFVIGWDESTDSEGDSEEDSDEEDDTPLSPPMPADTLTSPHAPLDTKVNMPRPQFSDDGRVITNERYTGPSDSVMPRPKDCPSSSQSNSVSLGENTGKAEYFAAREINRRRFSIGEELANSGHEIHLPPLADVHHSRYLSSYGLVPGYPRVPRAMLSWADGAAHSTSIDNMSSHDTGPDSNDCGHLGPLPNSDVPISTSDEPHAYGGVHSAMNVRRTHVGINELVNHQDRHLGSVPGYRDATDALCKQSSNPPQPTSRTPSFAQLMASRHDGSAQDVDTDLVAPSTAAISSKPEAVSRNQNSPSCQRKEIIRDAAGVKRSIDQISQECEEEKTWAAQSDTQQETSTSIEPLDSSVKQPLEAPPETPPINITSPPATPATLDDESPTKRRRKVAETFGIATLGAISASIGIFAALVATAPNLG